MYNLETIFLYKIRRFQIIYVLKIIIKPKPFQFNKTVISFIKKLTYYLISEYSKKIIFC